MMWARPVTHSYHTILSLFLTQEANLYDYLLAPRCATRRTNEPSDAARVTHVSGPDFIALQVRDLERATDFYEQKIDLKRTSTPAGVSGVVVFETSTIPFGLREPLPGTDLEARPLGLGVSLSLHVDDAMALLPI